MQDVIAFGFYDETLCERESEKSFQTFYRMHFNNLYNVAYYYTRCSQMSEEIVSDVFLKIWLKRHQLDEIRNIQSYLYISVKNQSLNYIQKNRKYHHEDFTESNLAEIWDDNCPERRLLKSELRGKVSDAIQSLPRRCQQIYKMVKVDGMKHKEVSDELGISIKTIEAQISIALKKLNTKLHTYCKEVA